VSSVQGKGNVREVRIEATVLGPCRFCGEGAEHWPAHPDCEHEPTFRRELGTVSRWHKNPLVRAAWKLDDRRRNGNGNKG